MGAACKEFTVEELAEKVAEKCMRILGDRGEVNKEDATVCIRMGYEGEFYFRCTLDEIVTNLADNIDVMKPGDLVATLHCIALIINATYGKPATCTRYMYELPRL